MKGVQKMKFHSSLSSTLKMTIDDDDKREVEIINFIIQTVMILYIIIYHQVCLGVQILKCANLVV